MKKYYIIKASEYLNLFNNKEIENHSYPISGLVKPGYFAIECDYYDAIFGE